LKAEIEPLPIRIRGTAKRYRENLAGTAMMDASPAGGLPLDSIALVSRCGLFPKSALETRIRELTENELEEIEGETC
jgi:mRNA-degrading endonuclease toxin of MazEF toxin-antitoxin module